MDDLLRFLETYEIWFYILLGAVGFIYFRKLLRALQEWRRAIFGLERELARRRFSSALTIVLLLSLLAFAEFFIVSFVSPVYPRASLLLTPTLDLLASPTPVLEITGSPQPASGQEGALVASTQVVSEGCLPGEVEWSSPGPGEEVRGSVELIGTVNLLDLGFYKYEFTQPGNENWITIAANNETKVDAVLGVWDTSRLIPGDYLLRLVVTNNQNQILPACVLPLRVVSP